MTTFADLGLNPMILQALAEIGFEKPTSIQSKTIPHLINSDKDLIALAQTGTGKTAAFSLPIIQQADDTVPHVQALILCPTRELAIQIANDIKTFVKYLSKVSVIPVYGGERIDTQIRALKNNPQIVVGTPGRVHDLIRRRVLKVDALKWLVLDEADEMLNMGFKEELDQILETMPSEKQVLLFSATMDEQIRNIAKNYMKKPDEITVGDKNKSTDSVEHFYYVVHEKDRYHALRRICDFHPEIHGIIFCRTRRETQQIADKLIQDHYSAEAIHGEVSQEQRTHVMNRFRDKKIQLLVATDVAARGIDVSGLTHVINYNLPESIEAYVHRSGRTGRAHSVGVSLVIVNMREKYKIRALERKIGRPFEQGKIPRGEDICEKQLFKLADNICNVNVNEEQINKYLDLINKKFAEMDREELIKKVVSIEFNRFLENYQDTIDISAPSDRDDSRGQRKSSMLFARFNINIGRNHGLGVTDLLKMLNSLQGMQGVEIGNIDINKEFTVFEIDERYKDKILNGLSDTIVNNIPVDITCEETGVQSSREPSRNRSGGGGRRRNFKGSPRGNHGGGHRKGPRKRY